MDWFKGKFTGKPHIQWENLWFPVDFPLNQSIDMNMYNVHVQKTQSQSPGLQALRQDPRGVRIDDDCHGPHRERRSADRALWCGGGQGAIPKGAPWNLPSKSHGEEKGETGPANPVKTMACCFRKWSQTWWFKHQKWCKVWDWTIKNRCQNQLEIRNDGALTHYKYGFIHEKTRNFRAGIFMVIFLWGIRTTNYDQKLDYIII